MIRKIKSKIKKLFKDDLDFNNNLVSRRSIIFPGGVSTIVETTKDDVFIVGFPKSGNTLMQHIIAHLVYGLNGNASRSLVNLIVPDIYSNSHFFRFNNRCFFKSHNLPDKRYKKVIYLIRDGREVLLSYYHMMKSMGEELSLVDLYSGKIKIFDTTWKEHIKNWERNPYNSEILWVKFEDLKKDKKKELNRICKFLNISKTEKELNDVIEFSSFEYMKTLENKSDWVSIKKEKKIDLKSNFVRKGKIDSFKDEVPENLIHLFETENQDILDKYYN